MIGPALSQLRRQAGVSVGSISVLFAVQSLGYLLGSIVGGRLYDRGLGHRVMAGALVICGISVAFVPALDTVIGLACVFWLVGVGAAAIDVGGNTLLVWSRGDTVGPMMNALHFSFGVGALLSPVLVDRSIAWGGDLRIACWTAAAVSVVIAVLLLARTAPSRLPVVAPRQPGARRPRPPALLVAFAVFFLLYVGVELGFAGWIFTYGEELGIGGARGPGLAHGTVLDRLHRWAIAERGVRPAYPAGHDAVRVLRARRRGRRGAGGRRRRPRRGLDRHVHVRTRRRAAVPDDDLVRRVAPALDRIGHIVVRRRRRARGPGAALGDRAGDR